MKHCHSFVLLLIGFALAAFGAARLHAQECPCPGAGSGWFGERYDLVQPDVLAEFPSGEFGTCGQTNNMAACGGPFCGYSCRGGNRIFGRDHVS